MVSAFVGYISDCIYDNVVSAFEYHVMWKVLSWFELLAKFHPPSVPFWSTYCNRAARPRWSKFLPLSFKAHLIKGTISTSVTCMQNGRERERDPVFLLKLVPSMRNEWPASPCMHAKIKSACKSKSHGHRPRLMRWSNWNISVLLMRWSKGNEGVIYICDNVKSTLHASS